MEERIFAIEEGIFFYKIVPDETTVIAPSWPIIASFILLSKGYFFLSSASRLRFLSIN
jgi:hypothetical protein